LIERGADVNRPLADTGETPLHAALCKTDSKYNLVVQVLLAHGANPNCATTPGVETGGFMRDCRTKGETPFHRVGFVLPQYGGSAASGRPFDPMIELILPGEGGAVPQVVKS
jgi:hypothetical protein